MKPWMNSSPAVFSVGASLPERATCTGLWLVYVLALLWLLCLTGCTTDPDDKRFFYDSWRLKNTNQIASDYAR